MAAGFPLLCCGREWRLWRAREIQLKKDASIQASITLLVPPMTKDNSLGTIVQTLRAAITAGGADKRLPSVRTLMTMHGVGPATVQRAFAILSGEGLIDPRPGQGTFVRQVDATAKHALADLSWQAVALGAARVETDPMAGLLEIPGPNDIPLSMGYLPPDLQATPLLAAALREVTRRSDLWDRVPVDGLDGLRGWFARDGGGEGSFSPHEVVVCPGGQSAISATLRALAPPGGTLLVEAPTYVGVIAAARAAGLKLVPVPTDADGVRPDLLEAAFRKTGARLFYCQPTFANPSGTVLARTRRNSVLEVLGDARAFAIEDDWARDLAFDTPPLPLAVDDSHGHVVLIRSLAKSAAPGLRVAAVMARGAALARFKTMRRSDDLFVSGLLQATALAAVRSPAWARHLRAARVALVERRDALVAAVREQFGPACLATVPQGGMHLWVQLPDGVSDVAVASELLREGVVVSAGRLWFPSDPPSSYLRLTFAAPVDVLRQGVARVGEVVRRSSPP